MIGLYKMKKNIFLLTALFAFSYVVEKWRVGSPDLLHIDTFSKNNISIN